MNLMVSHLIICMKSRTLSRHFIVRSLGLFSNFDALWCYSLSVFTYSFRCFTSKTRQELSLFTNTFGAHSSNIVDLVSQFFAPKFFFDKHTVLHADSFTLKVNERQGVFLSPLIHSVSRSYSHPLGFNQSK